MIEDSKNKTTDMNYNISLHTAADAITGAIVKGECAIAALPTNVAVKLFNKSEGKLQLLALNTLGVLYLLEDGTQNITSLNDLKGKTIYLPGAGSNPEYITAALLTAAGLEIGKDVKLDTTTYNSPDALQTAYLKLGASGNAFETIIASGENGSLCHAIPGPRKLGKGDMITMDFGAKVDGYCSDMTRTVALGEPSVEMRRVYDTVLQAQILAEDALAPGKTGAELDKIARDYIDGQGYEGRFGHSLGHAVGIDIHENPRLSYISDDVMVPGVVITVEPGVYIPGLGGVRIENTCLVTEGGCEPLTTPTKELIIL